MRNEKKWNIELDSIKDKRCSKMQEGYRAAESQMRQRTHHHELYGLLAKNKSIHEYSSRKKKNTKQFSEGSTQYILRKVLADTIQRMPDGELVTQHDRASMEHVLLEYLFKNKVMWEEFDGIDMLSNITSTFKMSFIYAFAPVRTGFVRDLNGEFKVTYNLENWADVFINPDCKDVRSPQAVFFRQYMSKADVKALLNDEDHVKDPTYNEDTIKYCLENDLFSAKHWASEKLGDQLKGSTAIESLTLVTEYRKGADEFVTFVPEINAVFRTVKNYDPMKGIPWNFLVLEPDPDFPLGVSQVEFLLADQQFNDAFQTSAYKNLLLAMEPPIMVSGWETNPSSYRFEPRRIWNLGNNPNAVKVDPVKIDNSILTGWTNTREAVSASMLRNLNVADGTIAKDAGVNYSKTAPGVEQQQAEKTISINQYQKRLETFIGQWANQALRCYLHAMGGVHDLTVDEETRRKLHDIGEDRLIIGNKVKVDFGALGDDTVMFKVRAGSLVQKKEDQEREAITVMLQPIIQNLNSFSEQNRDVVENEVLLPAIMRMLELSDTDIAQTAASALGNQIVKDMLSGMQEQIDMQGQQIMEQGMQMQQMQQAVPEEAEMPGQLPPDQIETPGQQVNASPGYIPV